MPDKMTELVEKWRGQIATWRDMGEAMPEYKIVANTCENCANELEQAIKEAGE